MRICVVGLGRIGLTLAVQFAQRGHHVFAADTDHGRVEAVSEGRNPFPDEPLLAERLAQAVQAGRVTVSTDSAAQSSMSSAVVVVVPLGLDARKRPCFDALDAATEQVARGLRRGSLVVYETTVPVGTTRGRLTPCLERCSGLSVGRELFVAYSPERVSAGRIFDDLRRYPKLVGGIDAASASRAVALYESGLVFEARPELSKPNGVWNLGPAESAEMAKLAEAAYRHVNIALTNELAQAADAQGVDLYAVIEAANSQPFSHLHEPGISIGGHCIPVYPYLLRESHPEGPLLAAASAVNESMPNYALGLLQRAVGPLRGKKVAILGLAYRPGVRDARGSGAFALAAGLLAAGAHPCIHDPRYSTAEVEALGLEPYVLGEPCDAAILHTAHPEYRGLSQSELPGAVVCVDGRRMWDGSGPPGLETVVIGGGTLPTEARENVVAGGPTYRPRMSR
jgi:nucleotide sugar dehydrogenase